MIVKGYGEKSVPKGFQWNIRLIDNSIGHLFRFYLELIFLLLIVCKVLREFLCLPHLSSRDMLKGLAKKQKFDLITCQGNCLASVLKQSWTDRFHKENEESLYRSSEFHYLLEFHLKDHKFCIFFHYFKSYEKGHVFCNNKKSDRVLESHPLIKKKITNSNGCYFLMKDLLVAEVCSKYCGYWCWIGGDAYQHDGVFVSILSLESPIEGSLVS